MDKEARIEQIVEGMWKHCVDNKGNLMKELWGKTYCGIMLPVPYTCPYLATNQSRRYVSSQLYGCTYDHNGRKA